MGITAEVVREFVADRCARQGCTPRLHQGDIVRALIVAGTNVNARSGCRWHHPPGLRLRCGG